MSRNFWIGLVSSVVVVAAAIGLLVLVRSVGGSGVDLPDEVAGLAADDAPDAYADAERPPADVLDRRREAMEYVADKVSDAFDGADAAVRGYRDPGPDATGESVVVTAVAADAGPLLPEDGFDDPVSGGTAVPRTDRVEHGDVECLVRRVNPPLSGGEADEADLAVDSLVCQRSGGSLTVRVVTTSGDVDAVVDLVEAVHDELD